MKFWFQGVDNLTPAKVINISSYMMQGKLSFMESKLLCMILGDQSFLNRQYSDILRTG